ncbi:MAG: ComF family protein [Candidatus Cloacimonetes bacterium]|nr:ComF family protein [Candidatus Cloacimonadota bacterium]
MVPKYSLLSNNPFSLLIDLIFPKICFTCLSRIEDDDNFLCQGCKKELQLLPDSCCPVCGSLNTLTKENCVFCQSEKVYFDRCRSIFPYNDVVRTLIHELKYNDMTNIAGYLAEHAIKYLRSKNPFSQIDYVCPVPLHPTRRRERGYNQAAFIAKKLASHFGWDYKPDVIKRVKFTESQANLTPKQRKENVNRAFSIDRNFILYEVNILIIDDVFTTGATVNSICQLLRQHRVNNIYVLTVARA